MRGPPMPKYAVPSGRWRCKPPSSAPPSKSPEASPATMARRSDMVGSANDAACRRFDEVRQRLHVLVAVTALPLKLAQLDLGLVEREAVLVEHTVSRAQCRDRIGRKPAAT